MGRPNYEDSTADGSGDASGDDQSSTDHLYFGGQTLGTLTHSDNSRGLLSGTLQESDNGTP
jgi:hypothetical protein